MADVLTSLNDFLGGMDLNFTNPIGLGLNLIISTIISGIVILIIVEIFSKKFAEEVNPMHAFLLALAINVINLPIVMGLIYSFMAAVPLLGIITGFLPVIIWIVLTKLLFRGLSWLHVMVIALLCYFLSIYLIPSLVAMVRGFIPF
jgi:hypothetical protein